MTNQSIIAVPPDLSDQTVLRRFLSLLVERVDVAVGNRDSDAFLAAQSALLASIANAKTAVETATAELEEATQRLDELSTTAIEELSSAINSNTLDIGSLEGMSALTACTIEFTVVALGAPDVLRSFNVASGSRIGVGVYEFDLTTTSYKGADLLTSAYGTFSHVIAPTLTTTLYSIAGEVVSASKFRIKVYEMTKAPSSDSIVATPYDLDIGDTVSAVYIYKLPGAIVPL